MIRVKGGITAPKDFKAASANCGIKRKRRDIALIVSSVPATACGIFTQNRVKAAPVLVCKEHLKKTTAQAIIVNSGNANCCTGYQGMKDAYRMAEVTAKCLDIHRNDVLVASTGVIGRRLPMDVIEKGIPRLAGELSREDSHGVAEAIMTTDRTTKEIAVKVRVKGKDITIGAVAKGAGMVHPNMATMLCFITTDAYITRRSLKYAVSDAADRTFNAISVDGDMSTNDAVLVLANGSAGNKLLDRRDKEFGVFHEAVFAAMDYLADAIVEDGEGSTKVARINVVNAKTVIGARRVARKIATSALFKTALFGEDPNWGRVAAAVGSSGVILDPDKLDIYLGKISVLKNGAGCVKDRAALRKLFKARQIDVTVDLNSGARGYTMRTCDLSTDYVRINAHYTT